MQYMFLIYAADGSGPQHGTPEFQEMMGKYMSFTQGVREAGIMDSGAPLEAVATATTVRVRDGATQTTDGPFAETKEVLGGYYILDCKDLDEAIKHAAQIPTSEYGSIEIRPVMDMS
jgi:hypothetical protein